MCSQQHQIIQGDAQRQRWPLAVLQPVLQPSGGDELELERDFEGRTLQWLCECEGGSAMDERHSQGGGRH